MRERLETFGLLAWPALALALVCAALIEAAVRTDETLSPRTVAWVLALGASLVVAKAHPAAATLAVAVLVLLLLDPPPSIVVYVLPVVLSYWCGAHATFRDGLAATLALAVAIQIHMGFSEAPNLEIAVATLPPWWCGFEGRRRRQLVRELAAQTRALEEEEESFVRLAIDRERTRIARDLHDIVSHHLALIVVQAGAGRLEETPRAGSNRRATIREAAVDALAEADRLVALLHPHGTDYLPRLAPLLDRARELGARVEASPGEPRLPPEIEAVAHFIVREAITNAMKHAPGAALEIDLVHGDGEVTIVARNDIAAADPTIVETGSGLGLAGMRDRAASLGGTLAVERSDESFRLRACLPLLVATDAP